MHFATLIPDWNSLDSVRRVHSDLEAAALVFFALLVVFDILAHLSTDDKKKTLLEKIGLICFAVAVLAEIVAYPYGQRNDALSAQVIGSLDAKSREASTDASNALTKSSEAETKADAAKTTSAKAVAESSSAMTIASGARREADSFEKDIVSAKTQAAEAASHLADALQRAANAEEEAAKLKQRFADRALNDEQARSIAAKIRPYAGQEFDVTPYWDLPESLKIAARIAEILNSPLAGWKYIPPAKNGFMLGGVAGVQVWIHPAAQEPVKKAADALVSALNAEHITAYIKEQNPQNPIDLEIHLNVGTRE